MKWKEDLTKDPRFGNSFDDEDGVLTQLGFCWSDTHVEFTEGNHLALQEAIDCCKTKPRTFLEIGVCRNGANSSTHTIIKNIPDGGIYLGVDLEDKSFLNNSDKGIHTIQTTSSNYELVVSRLKELGVEKLDFIFIDGYHSINQVLADWEYTKLLSDGGVVAFHDTTAHPGPYFFMESLDRNKWEVYPNVCPKDHGFGYCFRRVT
jgi:cephalosporin hydroxylase